MGKLPFLAIERDGGGASIRILSKIQKGQSAVNFGFGRGARPLLAAAAPVVEGSAAEGCETAIAIGDRGPIVVVPGQVKPPSFRRDIGRLRYAIDQNQGVDVYPEASA